MPDTNNKMDAYIDAHLDHYITETARLCSQPSVSAQKYGMHECANLVEQMLKEHGFEVQQYETPGNPVVVGHLQGQSDRTLLCYNHYDVQPPEPLELWTTPPFEPDLRDGALYARGVKDDKGEFVARLAALEAVREAHGGELPCNITFCVEGEEEIGSPTIRQFVLDHLDILKCDGAIWEEGTSDEQGRSILSLGARGILSVDFSAEAIARDAHSGLGSVLPNANWRLIWALSSLKGPDERIRIPGFYDDALPPSERDLELITKRPSEEEALRREYGVKQFVRGATGLDFNRAVFEPTCNVAGIWGGYQGQGMKTVIPAHSHAKVDFRLVPDQDPEDIFDKLRKHLDNEGFSDVQAGWISAMWPWRNSLDDPLTQLTLRTAEEVYGKPSVIIPMSGGSSPMYAFAGPLNIPVTVAGVGYPGTRAHSPNENLRLDDFVKGARHIARIMDAFADL